jgi:cytochrome P450
LLYINTLIYLKTDEADLEVKKPSLAEVVSDGALAVVAGADTVATALTSLLYLLLTHPDELRKVVEEVNGVYPPGSDATSRDGHGKLVYLDACL